MPVTALSRAARPGLTTEPLTLLPAAVLAASHSWACPAVLSVCELLRPLVEARWKALSVADHSPAD